MLIVAEERLPTPFDRPDGDPTFAVALHFSHAPGRPEQPDSLDLGVRLEPRATLASPTLPDHDSAALGLPSMVPSVVALARAIARMAADPHCSPSSVELGSRADPSVDLRWSLHLEHV